MGLKDWFWNDNASELFSLRKSDLPHCRDQAQKAAKSSIAFGSTLLFGTEESQGLLKTVSEVSAKVGRSVIDAAADSSPTTTADSDDWQIISDGYHHDGPEGAGEYMGGMKVPMYDND